MYCTVVDIQKIKYNYNYYARVAHKFRAAWAIFNNTSENKRKKQKHNEFSVG